MGASSLVLLVLVAATVAACTFDFTVECTSDSECPGDFRCERRQCQGEVTVEAAEPEVLTWATRGPVSMASSPDGIGVAYIEQIVDQESGYDREILHFMMVNSTCEAVAESVVVDDSISANRYSVRWTGAEFVVVWSTTDNRIRMRYFEEDGSPGGQVIEVGVGNRPSVAVAQGRVYIAYPSTDAWRIFWIDRGSGSDWYDICTLENCRRVLLEGDGLSTEGGEVVAIYVHEGGYSFHSVDAEPQKQAQEQLVQEPLIDTSDVLFSGQADEKTVILGGVRGSEVWYVPIEANSSERHDRRTVSGPADYESIASAHGPAGAGIVMAGHLGDVSYGLTFMAVDGDGVYLQPRVVLDDIDFFHPSVTALDDRYVVVGAGYESLECVSLAVL
jgi:hypothetical protein